MPRRRSTPSISTMVRPRTSSTGAWGRAGCLSTFSRTLRPTISSASCSGLVWAVLTDATISPRRITLTLSVISMISRSLWVIRMIVLPSSRSPLRMRNRWSASAGVSTPVGSSRIRMSAWRYSALRISTRCWWPTDRFSTTSSGSTFSWYSAASCFSTPRALDKDGRSSAPSSTPRMMFSSTVKFCTSLKCWNTMPMPARIAVWLSLMLIGLPPTRIWPSSGL